MSRSAPLVLAWSLVAVAGGPAAAWAAAVPDAREIVRNADRVRNVAPTYVVDVEITTHRPGRAPAAARYEVYTKDRVKSLVKFTAPASEKGKALLMVRQDMWIYMPTASRPIRLSPLQRLLGDVANGDLARTNYSEDYEPTLSGEGRLGEDDCYVLELKARDDGLSYHRIRYWVARDSYRPLRAEFYTLSDALLKTGEFRYSVVRGELRPTELLIRDPRKEGHYSLIRYSNVRTVSLAESLFRQESLRDLR